MKRTLAAFSAMACALMILGGCALPPATENGRRSDTTCDHNGGGDAVGDPTNPCNLNRNP
jgi:hypothetical protein